jgi:hypothetical protein
MQGDPEALVRLTLRSLEAGHWRVACRRFLMLRASTERIPIGLQETCEALLRRCSHRERLAMSHAAEHWAQLLSAGATQPDASASETAREHEAGKAVPEAAAPSAGIRTQWRPLPAFLRVLAGL